MKKATIFIGAIVVVIFVTFILPFILVETVFKDWFCKEAVKRGDVIQIQEFDGKKIRVYLMPQCLEYVDIGNPTTWKR